MKKKVIAAIVFYGLLLTQSMSCMIPARQMPRWLFLFETHRWKEPKTDPIAVSLIFETANGFTGMKRDIILRLIDLNSYEELSRTNLKTCEWTYQFQFLRKIFGMNQEQFSWSKSRHFELAFKQSYLLNIFRDLLIRKIRKKRTEWPSGFSLTIGDLCQSLYHGGNTIKDLLNLPAENAGNIVSYPDDADYGWYCQVFDFKNGTKSQTTLHKALIPITSTPLLEYALNYMSGRLDPNPYSTHYQQRNRETSKMRCNLITAIAERGEYVHGDDAMFLINEHKRRPSTKNHK